MAAQVSESDPRVKRTRQLLVQALRSLIMEKPFRDITVQDIANRATVNRATVYAHYEDKYALMAAVIREELHQLLAKRLPEGSAWAPRNLHLLVEAVFEFMDQLQHACTPAGQEMYPMLQTAVQEELTAILLGWLESPEFTGLPLGADANTLATVWGWAIFGTAAQWGLGARKVPAGEMAGQVASVLSSTLAGNGER
jgi:AcrR family transcriptional regulator